MDKIRYVSKKHFLGTCYAGGEIFNCILYRNCSDIVLKPTITKILHIMQKSSIRHQNMIFYK